MRSGGIEQFWEVRTKPRTLQEAFVKEIEGAAAKPLLPWLLSAWGPLSVALGKVTQGRAAKREAVMALYIVDLCRHTSVTANAICLSEVGI